MSIFYTSDLHFGHANILVYCEQRYEYLGLPSDADVTDMNEGLVACWNSQVTPDDVVYVLGDMCMGKVNETIEWVGRLNGTKHLVWGNHDRPHPGTTKNPDKRQEWENRYAEFFTTQTLRATWDFDDIEVTVNHFPFHGIDHTEGGARYNADIISQYEPTDEGDTLLLHGHVHDLYRYNGRMMNLGVDAWEGRFVTAEEIAAYFRSVATA
jgi:calcineurin-like phosphoesterase family protein